MPIVLPNKISTRDNNSGSSSKLEPDTGNAALGDEKESPRHGSRYCITFTHYRHRRIDPDNISGKAALDALVSAQVLPDDSAKCIEEIRHRQIKIKTDRKEYTVIRIYEIIEDDDLLKLDDF